MVKTGVTDRVRSSWKANEESFARFLTWLDGNSGSEGEEFLRLRSRLSAYFERRGCEDPDELADQTLERVNRRLDEAGAIDTETPAKFCYITAKFVFLEYLRSGRRREECLDPADMQSFRDSDVRSESEQRERISVCLDRCLSKLATDERTLITGYYVGERREKIENRRQLAETLQISPNALAIRACRIRERLEGCVVECRCEGEMI